MEAQPAVSLSTRRPPLSTAAPLARPDIVETLRYEDILIPKFQRGYVWKPSQASKLIESFMMGLPVPPVFLATSDDERSIVIDGMQRLLTVFSYLDGAYPKDSIHKDKKFW